MVVVELPLLAAFDWDDDVGVDDVAGIGAVVVAICS
jgi:hypothetical protein